MKKFWGYVDKSGCISIKYFVNKSQLTHVLNSANIKIIIHPFDACNFFEAYQLVRAMLDNAS
jgi:hypothetical protein